MAQENGNEFLVMVEGKKPLKTMYATEAEADDALKKELEKYGKQDLTGYVFQVVTTMVADISVTELE